MAKKSGRVSGGGGKGAARRATPAVPARKATTTTTTVTERVPVAGVTTGGPVPTPVTNTPPAKDVPGGPINAPSGLPGAQVSGAAVAPADRVGTSPDYPGGAGRAAPTDGERGKNDEGRRREEGESVSVDKDNSPDKPAT
jgi:hypothetical protein